MRVNTSHKRVLAALAFAFTSSQVLAQDRPVVVVDAGHGGPQNGVVHEEWLEKDLVLEMAFIIGAEFASAGYDIIYTRTTDVDVDWPVRRQVAEEADADVLLMLHAMGKDDPVEYGMEIYFDTDASHSVRLVNSIAERVREEGGKALADPRPWPFLESTDVATAMIEMAHMSNPAEARLLRSTEYKHDMGKLLVAAVDDYLSR